MGVKNGGLAETMGPGGRTVASGRGKPVKLTPSRRMYGLGGILLIALTICSRKFGGIGGPYFIVPLAVAGIVSLLAIREFFAAANLPPPGMVMGLALAALWHIPFLLAPAGPDDDIDRYLW